jgi:phospholipid/cholesterol/gamma-HCH transport system permease protein
VAAAEFLLDSTPPEGPVLRLSGRWTLASLAAQIGIFESRLTEHGRTETLFWDLTRVEALDSVGAMLLWRSWGRRLPEQLAAHPEHLQTFERMARSLERSKLADALAPHPNWISRIGGPVLGLALQLSSALTLLGQLVLDVIHLARFPAEIPWKEISTNVYRAGVLAMPVTALVGFLIGVVLSYLSALQLKSFGADIFIINILGIGITRELGPVLVAVLVAGRSGSAMTAQLGVMRVTEEIDALSTMGISRSLRLVLPKVIALSLAMPLLVLWTTAVALLGGMVSAQVQLDISYGFFIESLPKAVPVSNLWIGQAKGFAFGIIVALVASHFGLRVRPNTESLSSNTTSSVVTAITAVILADSVFAIATREIGLPR